MTESVLEIFRCQYEENDCFSSSLYNILGGYSEQLGEKKHFKLSKGKINKICGYEAFSGIQRDTHLIASELQKYFEENFPNQKVSVKYNVNEMMKLEELKKIIVDVDSSLPLTSLSYEYFEENEITYKVVGEEKTDHSVVVLDVFDDRVKLHDPRECYQSPREECERTIKTIPEVRFVNYWSNAEFSYEAIWLTKRESTDLRQFNQNMKTNEKESGYSE